MTMGLVLRISMILGGIIITVRILKALARRRMIEVYSVSWELFSIFLILAGILIRPVVMERYIGWPFFILLLIFAVIAIAGLLRITEHLSDLLRKSTEMEMQISLLNEENYRLKRSLRQKDIKEKT